MVFTELFLQNALAIRPCNYEAALELLLPKVAHLHSSSLIALYRKVRCPCFEALWYLVVKLDHRLKITIQV